MAQEQSVKFDARAAVESMAQVASDKAIVAELVTAMIYGGVITPEDAGQPAAVQGCRVSIGMAEIIEDLYDYEAAFGLEGCLPPIQESVGRVCLGTRACKRPALVNQECIAGVDGNYCRSNRMAMEAYLACVFGDRWFEPQISDQGWILHTQDLVNIACSGISMSDMWHMVIAPFRHGNVDECECALMGAILEAEIQREIGMRSCWGCPVVGINITPIGGGITIH